MGDFIENFQDLKISAFKKVKCVNRSIHNVTLGPNSTFNEDLDLTSKPNEKKEKKRAKPKASIQITQPITDLRILLNIKEMQRLEKVQEAITYRQKLMANHQQMYQNRTKEYCLQKDRELLLSVEHQEMQILQAEEDYDKNLHVRYEQQQRYYQELEEKRKRRDEELLAKEQIKKNLECMNKITKNQQEIGLVYQDIISILKSNVMDETIKKSISVVSQKLKLLSLEMEEVTKTCKVSASNVEVEKSSDLLQQMIVLKEEVQQIIIDYNKQKEKIREEQLKVAAKEMEKPAATVPTIVQEPPRTENVPTKIDKFVSKSSFRIYSELQQFLQNHQKSYADLLANDTLKQFKFDCKKAVNIPVNAISAVNSHHLLDKYLKLSNLLSGQSVSIGDSQISATRHPQGIAFCMDLLTKKFILQCDLMISSNPEAAFCYATIILSLWNDFPDFGKLLLAHFHKQCPYLVPIHLPQAVGQTNEEYYRSLGYQYVDGVVEKQDKFLKRMNGIMRLYSAILISKPKKSQKELHPHGLSQGWRWLTATLNLEPKTDITATLIHVFLETAGAAMQFTYKMEFRKIIFFIIKTYMPMLKKIDSGGPYTRLEVLLQEYQAKGVFPEPTGTLSGNYW